MKELIKKILQWQKYELINNEDFLELYKKNDHEKIDYWLIIHSDTELILSDDLQSSWLAKCKKVVTDPAFEKNINLLIIFEHEGNNPDLIKRVNLIEENSYFFRKRVLFYTKEELLKLQKIIEEKELDEVFEELISDTEIFSKYKLGDDYHSLLYRIMIKVSTIKINEVEPVTLENLYENIQLSIVKSNNSKILQGMDKAISELDISTRESKELFDWLDLYFEENK